MPVGNNPRFRNRRIRQKKQNMNHTEKRIRLPGNSGQFVRILTADYYLNNKKYMSRKLKISRKYDYG